ncbi:unnamed protein product [Blepharisma stoltei]|uniref:Uncharacterized protein n=1 Tax=Blepharisma stoltei TaxID=1481888 RepID=A0AAU9IZH0_9CILI|nr:unnamed protein product [Blepharisma stoltei]
MNKISRAFSSHYPYHIITKSEAQKLLDFPLQFYSEKYPKESKETRKSYNHHWKKELEGIAYSCGMFLSLLAKENLKELEDLLEWNMFKTLEKSIKIYKDSGYTISSIGSAENPKVEVLDVNTYEGCLLPYRNLNLESSKYKTQSYLDKEPYPSYHRYKLKTEDSITDIIPEFYEFESLNLKEICTSGNAEIYKEQIDELRWYLDKCHIKIWVIDIGYISTFKLLVKNKEGDIVEGTNDENKLEFHSFRMEMSVYEEGLVNCMFDPQGRLKRFLKANQGLLDQYTISDVDGFMNGNPFTT